MITGKVVTLTQPNGQVLRVNSGLIRQVVYDAVGSKVTYLNGTKLSTVLATESNADIATAAGNLIYIQTGYFNVNGILQIQPNGSGSVVKYQDESTIRNIDSDTSAADIQALVNATYAGGGSPGPSIVNLNPGSDYQAIDVSSFVAALENGQTIVFANNQAHPAILTLSGYSFKGGLSSSQTELAPYGVVTAIWDGGFNYLNIVGSSAPYNSDNLEVLTADLDGTTSAIVTMNGTYAGVVITDGSGAPTAPVVGTPVYIQVETPYIQNNTPVEVLSFDNNSGDPDFYCTGIATHVVRTGGTNVVISFTPVFTGTTPAYDGSHGFFIRIG